jgi:CRP-like cAMP-binding protein
LLALLERHPLFAALEKKALERVVLASTEVHLADQEILYTSGEPADRVFVLLSGALQIEYPLSGATRGKVSVMLLAPSFLGECQVLNEQKWSGTGVAVTDLIALGIKKSRFVELTSEHPRLTQALYFELTVRFLNAIESWRHEPAHKPETLVARYLLARSEVLVQLGRAGDLVEVRQVDLARSTGIRPETVNRILSRWNKSEITAKLGDAIRIAGQDALREIAESTNTPPLILKMKLPAAVAV